MASSNRSAILKLSAAMLFIAAGSVVLFLGVLSIIQYSAQIKTNVASASPMLAITLLLVGGIVALRGALDVYRGFTAIDYIGKVYDNGRYGALAQFAAALLLTLGFYLLVFSNSTPARLLGGGFSFAGYVIGIVCAFPVGVAFYNLGEKYRSDVVKKGAVVYVLVPIIGPLILHFGLKEIAGK